MTTKTLTIDALGRWVLFGAERRVVHVSDERAVVALCTCAGEARRAPGVRRPLLIGYLRSARSDLDLNRGVETQNEN